MHVIKLYIFLIYMQNTVKYLHCTRCRLYIRAVKMGQDHRAAPSALYFSVGQAVKKA